MTNRNVGAAYCRAEMYAGRVTCCPWWVMVSMSMGHDRQTDGRQTVTLSFPLFFLFANLFINNAGNLQIYAGSLFISDDHRIIDLLEEQLKTSPIQRLSGPQVMYQVSLEPGQRTINSSSPLRSISAPSFNSRSAQPTTTTRPEE